MTDGCNISSEIALRWTSLDLCDDKSTLVQVMAWCRQATRHYLSQCWPRSMSPNGVTGPQWVNCIFLKWNLHILIEISWKWVQLTMIQLWYSSYGLVVSRADSRFAPSQWEQVLLCNDVSHWPGTNLESALSEAASHHLRQWCHLVSRGHNELKLF